MPAQLSEKQFFNLENLTNFRHWMHQNAELSFQEFKTQAKVIEYLTQNLKLPESEIKIMAKTGCTIDIYGTAAPKGNPILIAARTDLDALKMAEENDLPYRSTTNAAHMCGHDGHTACLLGGISLLLDNLEKIPSNRGVRFLFQPAEEGYIGAHYMVQDGCMKNVKEVYGLHNIPKNHFKGKFGIKKGYMLRSASQLTWKIIGKGGHGSQPEKCKNPLPVACEVLLAMDKIFNEFMESHPALTGSIPMLKGSEAKNVIVDEAIISGTIRNFDVKEANELVDMMNAKAKEIVDKTELKLVIDNHVDKFPAVDNSETQVEYVREAVRNLWGDICIEDELPESGSEDFSYF